MADTTFEIAGLDKMVKELNAVAQGTASVLAEALRAECEIEMAEAKRRTPVDTGALRSSGHVDGPTWSGRDIEARLVFGGPSAEYALQVHEDMEAFHRTGQAKFLESTLLESAPHLAKRLATRMAGGFRSS